MWPQKSVEIHQLLSEVSFQVHASDILNVYGDGEMTDYLVRFVANLNPNGNTGINWPQYTPSSPNLLTFLDGPVPLEITQDTFRQEAIAYLTNVTLANPIWKSESWKIVVVFLITCTIYNVSLRRKTWWSTSLHPKNKQNNTLITLFLLGVITVAYTQYLYTFWDQSWCPKWGETNIFPYYIYNCSWALAPYLSN